MNSLFSMLKFKKKEEKKNIELENNKQIQIKKSERFIKNTTQMICDDAYLNRLVLKKVLESFDCKVDEAENGFELIEKIKNNGEYDIVWLDIKMPKMDGIECTRYLRNELNYSGIIIGLTGCVDEITINSCYKEGVTHVLSKPFDRKIIR